jgi:hypothetical protein
VEFFDAVLENNPEAAQRGPRRCSSPASRASESRNQAGRSLSGRGPVRGPVRGSGFYIMPVGRTFLTPLPARPSRLALEALRGASGGATMVTLGGAGTPRKASSPVPGAPASLMGVGVSLATWICPPPCRLVCANCTEFRPWGCFPTKLLTPVPCHRFSYVHHGNEPLTQYIRMR